MSNLRPLPPKPGSIWKWNNTGSLTMVIGIRSEEKHSEPGFEEYVIERKIDDQGRFKSRIRQKCRLKDFLKWYSPVAPFIPGRGYDTAKCIEASITDSMRRVCGYEVFD